VVHVALAPSPAAGAKAAAAAALAPKLAALAVRDCCQGLRGGGCSRASCNGCSSIADLEQEEDESLERLREQSLELLGPFFVKVYR
jgi:hypothetical protein